MECLPPDHLCCYGGSGRSSGSSLQQPQHQPHQVPHEVPRQEEAQQNLGVCVCACAYCTCVRGGDDVVRDDMIML